MQQRSQHTHLRIVTRSELERDAWPYLRSLTPHDLCARGARSVEEYAARYLGAVLPAAHVPRAIVDSLVGIVARADGSLREYRAISSIPWAVAVLGGAEGACEGGFPHTVGGTIVVHVSFLLPSRGSWTTTDDVVTTMIHEKVHVYQRAFPAETQTLIREALGYEPVGLADSIFVAGLRRRSNPDIDAIAYARRDGRVCVQTYDRECPRHLADSRVVCTAVPVDLDADRRAPDDEREHEPYEHPFEHMAYLLADVVTGKRDAAPAVRRWMRAYL